MKRPFALFCLIILTVTFLVLSYIWDLIAWCIKRMDFDNKEGV